MKCHYCAATKDLRPYGPKGAMVCFKCGTSPEHNAESTKNFLAQLNSCVGPVEIGTSVGPVPLHRTIDKLN